MDVEVAGGGPPGINGSALIDRDVEHGVFDADAGEAERTDRRWVDEGVDDHAPGGRVGSYAGNGGREEDAGGGGPCWSDFAGLVADRALGSSLMTPAHGLLELTECRLELWLLPVHSGGLPRRYRA